MKRTGTRSRRSKKLPAFIPILLILLAAAAGAFLLLRPYVGRTVSKAVYPLRYAEELKAAADRYGLDRALVAAVVNTESGFRSDAVSGDGAVGLMQVLPSTAEWIAFARRAEYEEGSLFDPETNLDYGCWLLRYLLDRYGGSVRNALIAYNAGHGRLESWLKEGADENGELINIPYAETRNYVEKVTSAKEKYESIYEEELLKN
ncbi:MAG: lytic transglycosylase domain-containing protein [Clostridiales bacterium]|nr:lytic transglycosylase domain-containing protein [Clostridiales bacterium]